MKQTIPSHVKRWAREELILVNKLLKEFTVQEVAEKTGISIGRITKKANIQGWTVRTIL